MASASSSIVKNCKCSVKGCPFKKESNQIQCSEEGCTNVVHPECYNFLVLAKNQIEHFSEDVERCHDVACSKRHCESIRKRLLLASKPANTRNIPWNKDGRNGPEDAINSESILLKWWASPGKYDDYRNGTGGKTKIQRCAMISDMIKDAGVVKECSAGDILNKIQSYERACKIAADFANNTGEGIRETDGEASLNQLVLKRFKHYFFLEPIMRDRSNIKPAASSDDFLNKDLISEIESVGGIDDATQDANDFLSTIDYAISAQATAPDLDDNFHTPKKIREGIDLTSKAKKKRKNGNQDTGEKISFEDRFLALQERQLTMEENKCKMDMEKNSIENRVTIMREVRKLQLELFSDEEILGMIPEAAGMLEAHKQG